MADREERVTFEDDDGLVTETSTPRGAKEGDSSTAEGAVAPVDPADTSGLPENPTLEEVFSAAHQAALRGEEIQDGSRLDVAMKGAMDQIANGTNLPADPSPQDVFGAMRQAQLLGLEVPADSPLQQAMDKVMEHIQTGDYLGDNPAPDEVFGAMRQAQLLGLEVPADSPLQQAMDKVMDQIQTGSMLGPNPSAADVLAAARQAELLGLTPPADSPLAVAMSNLTGSTGGMGASSTTGFPSPGGMTSSGGTSTPTTPGSSNNDTTETPVDRNDPAGMEPHHAEPASSGSTGSTGTGATPAAGTPAEYTYTSPMGTTGVLHADGTETITNAAGEDVTPSTGGQDSDPPPDGQDDPPPEDEEEPPPEEEDDDDGMVDPDAASGTTGLATGIFVQPVDLDDVLFGSSTSPGGGATDGPRGDLDTGNGTITGEIVGPAPSAGPDVDPDYQATGDRLADPFHSGTGVGTVDGVRPDLLDAVGGGGAPEMDPSTGIDPYAAGDGDDDLAAAPAHLAAGQEVASFGGAEENAFGDIPDTNLQIDSDLSAIDDQPDPSAGVGVGDQLDDGFDPP